MSTAKKTKSSSKGGRPPLVQGEASVVITLRLSAAQRDKLARIGGAARFRKWLDAAKEEAQ